MYHSPQTDFGVGSPSFSSPPTSYHNRDSGTTTSHGQGPSPSHLRERRDTESHGGAPGSRPFASPTFGDPTTRSQRDVPSPNPANASGAAPGTVGSRISMSVRGRARRSKAPTIIARDRAIEKQALVESAERIYLRYLLPGAEREIYLPSVKTFLMIVPCSRRVGVGTDDVDPRCVFRNFLPRHSTTTPLPPFPTCFTFKKYTSSKRSNKMPFRDSSAPKRSGTSRPWAALCGSSWD